MTLLDLFDASVVERGPAPAIGEVTYRELADGVARVAQRLRARGLRTGDRFGLYCENRLAFVYAYLAALRLGAIAVPVNVLYRAAELAHVLTDARPRMVLASGQTRGTLTEVAATLTDAFAAVGESFVAADEVEAWAAASELPCASFLARDSDDAVFPAADPDAPALIIYTSGTTGRSKGAVLTHGNLAAIAAQLIAAWRWTARDTLVTALPLFHLHGLGAALNGTLACGGRLIVASRFDAASMLTLLQGPAVTMFFGVPTMYVRLLELPDPVAFPPLRLCVSGSAALSRDVFERFRRRFGVTILERYGATEFGFALGNRFAGPRIPGSVGVPFPGVRVRIAASAGAATTVPGFAVEDSPTTGSATAREVAVGELLVNGPNVFAGYWRNPQATAEAFSTDDTGTRWYRSGDLASYDAADAVYRIVGRTRDLIVSGGFNVYPLEVENEIDRYPGVRASAVVGATDVVRGESVVAFVEADPSLDMDGLIGWLSERLASFKIPKAVHVIAELPRNALGKVDKPSLRTRLPKPSDP